MVISLAIALVVYGGVAAQRAKLDVFPEFAPPQVVIQGEAPGLSPPEVEALVTRPIESAVIGAGNLESIRSESIPGLAVVTVIFREDTDITAARSVVAERLVGVASQLPQGVPPPVMAPLTSATSTILVVGLTSKQRTPMELRTLADWTLRPRLLGIQGVAKVNVFGGEQRELQIQVIPDRLRTYHVALEDVLDAARLATGVRGAGFIETGSQRIWLRSEGQTADPARLAQVAVAQRGATSVRLGDVANVVDGAEPKVGDAAVQGEPGVILVVSSQYGANTLEVTGAVEAALAALAPALAADGIEMHPRLFRAANFIDTALGNIRFSLLLGALLVAAVLLLFQRDLRTALISFSAIPLSLLAALVTLQRFGVTVNTLTLGGLAIAIGEVVDDAIIDVENISRRLRENARREHPRPAFRVVLDASLEVRSAVVYATFVVALVFVPVLTLTGLQGRLFAPLALAYVLAIFASLAVALTVTPALSFALLAGRAGEAREPAFLAPLRARYRRALEAIAARPRRVIGAAVALSLGAAAMVPFFGGEFLPQFYEGHVIVHMAGMPGMALAESMRVGRRVAKALLENPHVRSVSQWAGRAEQADDTWGPHYSEFNVDLADLPGRVALRTQAELRAALARFPGVSFAVTPFLTERIEETISGSTADVVVQVYGDDLDVLDEKAAEVARVLSGIRGATDVQADPPPGLPERVVRLRPERLARFGFRPVDVLDAVQAAYEGASVAETHEGNRVLDVAVILDPAARRDPEGVDALLLRSPSGARVRLGELAEITTATGRYSIFHEATRRRVAVTCNVRGRDLASFAKQARSRIAKQVAFPPGVFTVVGGAADTASRARRELLLHAALAGLGIVLLLSIPFRRPRHLLLVLANLPFALVGGVLAVLVTGASLSLGSLVGFVTLFGITTRNSIMLVSHYEHLVQVEGMSWGLEAAVRGAAQRLVPILMTALVTGLGLLPLALGSADAGREVEGPMAIVILGGLATSTALNLLVLPTLALRYGQFEA